MDINMNQLMQRQALTMLPNKDKSFVNHLPIFDVSFQQLLQDKINMATNQTNTLHKQANYTSLNTPPQVAHSNKAKQITKSTYDPIIKEMSNKYGVNEQLVRSVIQAESNYNHLAKSHAGAQGLMQLMPSTAKALGVNNPFDPRQNIEGGVKYLQQMIHKYNGNIKLALAAYNAGPGNVDKYQGIPPFNETQNYVNKVLNNYYA